jgi:sterol desaturase/sphingolipid hydroxylase (fatty acid hydroxylase superfamily)
MSVFALEHNPLAYIVDFVFYGVLTSSLAVALVVFGLGEHGVQLATIACAGAAAWTLLEYAIHRFVLHGLRPFSDWHAEHHRRPSALVCTPTLVSAMLIAGLVLLPALLWAGPLRAGALTLGVLAGYLAYSTVHHAAHHWRPSSSWARRCKRRHALHHRHTKAGGHYGVTSGFWDYVFATSS